MAVIIRKLVWDEWNLIHIAKHDVSKDEVEEVCRSNYFTLETYNHRILLMGVTFAGRQLTVVLALKTKGSYYPVTARTSSRKERRYYQKVKGGEQSK